MSRGLQSRPEDVKTSRQHRSQPAHLLLSQGSERVSVIANQFTIQISARTNCQKLFYESQSLSCDRKLLVCRDYHNFNFGIRCGDYDIFSSYAVSLVVDLDAKVG